MQCCTPQRWWPLPDLKCDTTASHAIQSHDNYEGSGLVALKTWCTISTHKLSADLLFSMVLSKEDLNREYNSDCADSPIAIVLGLGWATARAKVVEGFEPAEFQVKVI